MSELRSLPVPLTNEQLLERATHAARVSYDVAILEVKLKAYVEEQKGEIKRLEGNVSALMRQVRERQEFRDVEIDYFFDADRGCVETIRLDTHAVIETRAMTAAELADARQTKLPGLGGGRRGRRYKEVADITDAAPGDQPEHVTAK